MVEHPVLRQAQLQIACLGPRPHPSPLQRVAGEATSSGGFVPDTMGVLYEPRYCVGEEINPLAFERAGARREIYFDPSQTQAAVVTCGGLCPGINNVIRSLVLELRHNYGVQSVLGIRYGYRGLTPQSGHPPRPLTVQDVESIHHQGGTILGSSRGPQKTEVIVDFLTQQKIDILFCVGGDGTQCGAHAIAEEVARRQLPIAIVGIPKTIDNDIKFCFRTFGFYSAIAEAERVIDCAHVEAKGVENGIGLVKLMGREAGFIAAGATMASGEANFTLIPEVPLELHGPRGFLGALERRLEARHHAVVVVAEGVGQELLGQASARHDASGNRRFGDIGPFLKEHIESHFETQNKRVSVKYFDPSYHIRSVPANAADSLLCERLARHAVHAAMAGKTDLLIGLWHNHLMHVPLAISTGEKKRLSPTSDLWTSVLALTGQAKWYG